VVFAPDLLRPAARRVGERGEVRRGLGGPAAGAVGRGCRACVRRPAGDGGHGRIDCGHGDDS
jgi:hypothetical protein